MSSRRSSAPAIPRWPNCNPASIAPRNQYAMRRPVFLDQKTKAVGQNDKALQYQIARQEATQSHNLYENMVSRIKEADLVAGLRSSNITLVDSARVPSRPAKPTPLLYAAAS